MNQRVGMVKSNRALGWLVLWVSVALLFSAFALLIGFGTKRASAAGTAPSYTVTDLGTLGGTYSNADDINENGQIVGNSSTGSGQSRAFIYEGGQMKDLGTLGGTRSNANDINENGQVVGSSSTGTGRDHGFLYEGGQMKDLGTLGGADSGAHAINDGGQVAGWSYIGTGQYHGFLYEGGQMKDLGTLGGTSSDAQGINNSGQVVGYSGTSDGQFHLYLYENGQMQDLGGNYAEAHDINDNGHVVGRTETSNGTRAFLYAGGQMKELGTLGGSDSYAYGINDNGQVVGLSTTTWGSYNSRPFLYEDGQMKDLTSLIPQDSGWNLEVANEINNKGQIVGYGLINGERHAFLLTPVPQTSVDSASQSVAADGTVSTATGDGSASLSDPVNTSITTPVAGTVSINETSLSQPETAGFSFFGQQVNIEAPQASVQNPLTLNFVIDSSLMPSGTDSTNLQLFRDGVRIEACDAGSSATTASPDPCIKQSTQLADGDASITVLSSHASAWNLGVAKAGTPLYSFKGFFQPVDKLPTVNTVKAGSAIPVKFSLGGDRGLDIFGAGYPISGRTPSDPGASLDAIEQTVTASASGLSYSAGTGQYTYTWKTDKAWAGQTRQLVLRLKDGTEHRAAFKFTK